MAFSPSKKENCQQTSVHCVCRVSCSDAQEFKVGVGVTSPVPVDNSKEESLEEE
ncbi:hypothetical protein DPMN_045647 [Dreissena polymorpha]|uniref:Uncharacterized protein n=1 Tax=Dreissena polymorpha TaxID=45954 RepID=A0A9D4D4R2_DREPO|nr:hypothetical protein DPMN_045647 [Dreissena polymorpha]